MRLGGRLAETRAKAALRVRELFEVEDPSVRPWAGRDAAGWDAARRGPAAPGAPGRDAVVSGSDASATESRDPVADVEDGDEGPPPRGAVRLGLDRRALAALLVIALGGVVLAGAVVLRSRPHVEDVPAARVLATGSPIPPPGGGSVGVPTAGPEPGGAGGATADLVVDVQGRVRHPGVVRLPPGSRVLDALAAAGGPRPGVPTSSLNLAEQLSDGEQVVLDPPDAAGAAPSGSTPVGGSRPAAGGSSAGASGGLVNLNTATLADLDGLPGVGPVLAQRILDWREEHGRFTTIEELQEVPGIGPSKFEDMKAHVRV